MRAFADALDAVPMALAENSGLSPIETLAAIKSRQVKEKNTRLGVDCMQTGSNGESQRPMVSIIPAHDLRCRSLVREPVHASLCMQQASTLSIAGPHLRVTAIAADVLYRHFGHFVVPCICICMTPGKRHRSLLAEPPRSSRMHILACPKTVGECCFFIPQSGIRIFALYARHRSSRLIFTKRLC